MNRADEDGWVPLISAAYGHVAVVEILLSRKELEMDRQNRWGYTAIWFASLDGHHQALRRLLEAGADPRLVANFGRTPLDLAREGEHDECIQLLEVISLSFIHP